VALYLSSYPKLRWQGFCRLSDERVTTQV